MSNGKLWILVEQFETNFAQAASRSPNRRIVPAVCARCGRGALYERPKPLVFEWEPGSDLIGDFVWPNSSRVVVKKSVLDALAWEFSGFHAETVEMIQDPKLKPPKRRTSRSKPRIWLPYAGPELVELWPDRIVPFLPATTIEIPYRCEDCGREMRRISGGEVKAHLYDRNKGDLVPDLQPRVPGQGVFVASSEVKDSPIFRLEEFSEAIFCTNDVKAFIESEDFTNIDFLEYGDVV